MESMSYREKAEEILENLLEIKPESGVTPASMLMLFYEALDEAGLFLDPEWEYGYRFVRDDGIELEVSAVTRNPSSWMTTMGRPYRRRKQIDAGEWELAPEDVVIELDPRPWLRPGGHPDYHPLDNRTAHKEGMDWKFRPRKGYEPAIEKYGFTKASCGRTDKHWPHGGAEVPYCNGIPR